YSKVDRFQYAGTYTRNKNYFIHSIKTKTMADSFSKKENSKKKTKKQQDKTARREDRKANNNKGKGLENMIVYVDVNGNFTSIPPHLQNREEDLAKAKKTADNSTVNEDTVFNGIVTYLSDKGYGFITEDKTGENVFF